MKCNPHLAFDGECRAAFHFYEKTLGGDMPVMMTFGESPLAEQTPPAWHEKILHATLRVGDLVLMGADAWPGQYQKPQGFAVLLHLDDALEADRIFTALSANGTVQMPIEETFWALRFGMLVDQFGTPWTVNCGKPD